MANKKRLARPPKVPVPELDEFLVSVQFTFRRRESRQATERYLSGLMTEYPNENSNKQTAVIRPRRLRPTWQRLSG